MHCQNSIIMELPLTCRWFIHSVRTCYREPSAGQAPDHSSERTAQVAVLKALRADKNGFSEIRRDNHVAGAQGSKSKVDKVRLQSWARLCWRCPLVSFTFSSLDEWLQARK